MMTPSRTRIFACQHVRPLCFFLDSDKFLGADGELIRDCEELKENTSEFKRLRDDNPSEFNLKRRRDNALRKRKADSDHDEIRASPCDKPCALAKHRPQRTNHITPDPETF
jgi:hypothetical protein